MAPRPTRCGRRRTIAASMQIGRVGTLGRSNSSGVGPRSGWCLGDSRISGRATIWDRRRAKLIEPRSSQAAFRPNVWRTFPERLVPPHMPLYVAELADRLGPMGSFSSECECVLHRLTVGRVGPWSRLRRHLASPAGHTNTLALSRGLCLRGSRRACQIQIKPIAIPALGQMLIDGVCRFGAPLPLMRDSCCYAFVASSFVDRSPTFPTQVMVGRSRRDGAGHV